MSNPVARGDYLSEAKACMTMDELERWIAIELMENIISVRIGGSTLYLSNSGISLPIVGRLARSQTRPDLLLISCQQSTEK